MKEYQIEVTSVTTVYVEADSEKEALDKAFSEALRNSPDIIDRAVIVGETNLED